MVRPCVSTVSVDPSLHRRRLSYPSSKFSAMCRTTVSRDGGAMKSIIGLPIISLRSYPSIAAIRPFPSTRTPSSVTAIPSSAASLSFRNRVSLSRSDSSARVRSEMSRSAIIRTGFPPWCTDFENTSSDIFVPSLRNAVVFNEPFTGEAIRPRSGALSSGGTKSSIDLPTSALCS